MKIIKNVYQTVLMGKHTYKHEVFKLNLKIYTEVTFKFIPPPSEKEISHHL